MKKVLSLVLCLLMLVSVMVPAASAANHPYPVVYVEGYGDTLYSVDGNKNSEVIYPTGADVGGTVKEALMPCLKELANGFVTDNYDKYADALYNAAAPIWADMVLNKDGTANGTSGDEYVNGVPHYKTYTVNGYLSGYKFGYDWRLSPMDIADELKTYIDNVKSATGATKVALVGRCLGGNMVSAYLAKYPEHAKANVDSVMLYVTSSNGIKLLDAFFTGEIVLDENNIERFADYLFNNKIIISDPDLKSLVDTLVPFFNEIKMLGLGMDVLQFIVDKVKDNLIPRLGLACYLGFPSFWSMISADKYPQAKAYMFAGERETEYAGMIAKLDDYYYNVQLKIDDVINDLEAAGVKFGVIAKYNVPALPLYAEADEQADFFTGIENASLGATAAKLDKTLSDSYINSLADKKYVSPDKKIDASTCRFPDKTWFVKDISHDDFPDSISYLIADFFNSKGAMTVFDNEKYPQYLQYNVEDESISPVAGLDPEVPENGSNEKRFSSFIRFFTSILNFFRKLFNGDFENLFG